MNLFTWISHTSRGGRGHRGGGGLDGDRELIEEVFGPGLGMLRASRKVKVMRKPKLWDFCVGESMKEFRDVKTWKNVMVSEISFFFSVSGLAWLVVMS